MAKPLTPTMVDALDFAEKSGGELVRYAGGYWAKRNAPRHPHNGVPIDHFGTNTIHGLVTRGYAKYSEHRQNRNGKFPVAIQVTQQL